MLMFGKSARTGNEIDMYVGQIKAKVNTAKMTLKQSDMIEMQFAQLADMAKRSGDAQLVMQFEMLKSLMDNMQNNTVSILNEIEQDLQKIDSATDKIQSGGMF